MKTSNLTRLGLLSAIVVVLSYTPLGYLTIGPVAVTLNPIALSIAAYTMGAAGGAVIGGVFGLTSFMQCFGRSALSTALFGINPFLTAVLCFLPRILDGFIIGKLSEFMRKKSVMPLANSYITSFLAAFLNTVFYMSTLILLFGNTEEIMTRRNSLAPGQNVFIFVCVFVGLQAVSEWFTTTVITGPVGYALSKSVMAASTTKTSKSTS